MRQFLIAFMLVCAMFLSACGYSQVSSDTSGSALPESAEVDKQTDEAATAETENQVESEQDAGHTQTFLPEPPESELKTEQETTDMIKFTIGNNSFFAKLENNPTANELRELLQNGPVTMSASNYGGFEKVCALGSRLTSNDVQTITQAGDIMLYNSSQIVIFYDSNSWAYTRLAKVVDEDIPKLRDILSGSETVVVIQLTDAES